MALAIGLTMVVAGLVSLFLAAGLMDVAPDWLATLLIYTGRAAFVVGVVVTVLALR